MARLGMNPQRGKAYLEPPPAITLTMITHFPYDAGYHKRRMEVMELSLNSMIKGARDVDYEIGIFDNGSCRAWTERLDHFVSSGYIDWVWKSHQNIGKPNALRMLLSGVQSDIIAYSDDDILFYEDWLSVQLALLRSWPNAVKVSGVPVKSLFPHYLIQADYEFAGNMEREVTAEVAKGTWPEHWLASDAMGRGISLEHYLKLHGEDDEIKLNYKDVSAWGHGHHCQLVGYRATLRDFFPLATDQKMGQMREWDNALQDSGLYQLTTLDRTARHIGNVLDTPTIEEAIALRVIV